MSNHLKPWYSLLFNFILFRYIQGSLLFLAKRILCYLISLLYEPFILCTYFTLARREAPLVRFERTRTTLTVLPLTIRVQRNIKESNHEGIIQEDFTLSRDNFSQIFYIGDHRERNKLSTIFLFALQKDRDLLLQLIVAFAQIGQ